MVVAKAEAIGCSSKLYYLDITNSFDSKANTLVNLLVHKQIPKHVRLKAAIRIRLPTHYPTGF